MVEPSPLPEGFEEVFPGVSADDELSLVELVNRVLDKGAVVSGDIVISVAGVDLVYVGLRVLVSSVESMRERRDADVRRDLAMPPRTGDDTRRLR